MCGKKEPLILVLYSNIRKGKEPCTTHHVDVSKGETRWRGWAVVGTIDGADVVVAAGHRLYQVIRIALLDFKESERKAHAETR